MNPFDYSLCCQTVTVYRAGEGVPVRIIYSHAYLEHKRVFQEDTHGKAEQEGFLLILPGEETALQVGDWVLVGEGPQVSGLEELAVLPGIGRITLLRPCYWEGRQCHVEAEGR